MKLPKNGFKQAIAAGKPQIGIWSSLCSNIAADVLGTAGFDWVLIDMEHSPNSLSTVLSQLQAYEVGGTHAVVRPAWNDPVLIKPLMDLGALTLLLPMVQNAEEASRAVRATRYPPEGIRGVSLTTRTNRYGRVSDYVQRVHDEVCVLVQVETRTALENVPKIARVDGVDGVFFGPTDLSADMGHLGAPGHPDVVAAITRGFDQVTAAGKPAGILVGRPEDAIHWLKTGFSFVACGSDLAVLARGSEAIFRTVSEGIA